MLKMVEVFITLVIGATTGIVITALSQAAQNGDRIYSMQGRLDTKGVIDNNIKCKNTCPFIQENTCCHICNIKNTCMFMCKSEPKTCKSKED